MTARRHAITDFRRHASESPRQSAQPPGHSRAPRVAALAALVFCLAGIALPRFPFPQQLDYAPGTLRPSLRTAAQQADDVRALYARWKDRYLEPVGSEADGHPRYRVRLGADPQAATVSEGQGYGMMISVLLAGHDPDAQPIFDGLWEFALDHPSEIDGRLMDWWVNGDESPDSNGDTSAFDGDCTMAYALLLAARQWGDAGRFDYTGEAHRLLAGILESTIGTDSRLPLLGDWVSQGSAPYSQYTPRPSDFIFVAFRSFARATHDPRWLEVAAAAHDALASVTARYSPTTALVPDFLTPEAPTQPEGLLAPAAPHFLEGNRDGSYYYNALRVPFWLGTDALLHGCEAAHDHAAALSTWIRGETQGSPGAIRSGYALDGTPLPGSHYFSTAFAGPLGVAAMTDAGGQVWVDAVYDRVRLSREGYYEDSLALLSLLVMTGNFWQPASFLGPGDDPWTLVGTAGGGTVGFGVAGVRLELETHPGETAREVAWRIAREINREPALAARAVTATVQGSTVLLDGRFEDVFVLDTGLAHDSESIPAMPAPMLALLAGGLATVANRVLRARAGRTPRSGSTRPSAPA